MPDALEARPPPRAAAAIPPVAATNVIGSRWFHAIQKIGNQPAAGKSQDEARDRPQADGKSGPAQAVASRYSPGWRRAPTARRFPWWNHSPRTT